MSCETENVTRYFFNIFYKKQIVMGKLEMLHYEHKERA